MVDALDVDGIAATLPSLTSAHILSARIILLYYGEIRFQNMREVAV